MTTRRAWWVALALLATFARPVHTQVVQRIVVTPASPLVNQQATIRVEGTSPCGAVGIDYGDGESIVYATTTLPIERTHVYTTPGAKTLTAKGHGNCSGEVTTTINVSDGGRPGRPGALEDLCRRVGCADAVARPVVTEVFGVQRPGGTVAVVGTNFGAPTGSVIARMERRDGSMFDQSLAVRSWKDSIIEAEWPLNMPEVRDQEVRISVESAGRARSTQYGPVMFRTVRQQNQPRENARIRAEIDRRARDLELGSGPSQEREAIQREARELWRSWPTASPAERTSIEQRAVALLERLNRIRRFPRV